MYPESEDVFKCLQLTDPADIRVVIVGQNPYHTPGFATGLAFSVPESCQGGKLPPSLRNILTELENDLGFKDPAPNPDLTRWSKQGVLLINSSLTVRKGNADSHLDLGWQRFVKVVLQSIMDNIRPTVFILWGRYAQNLTDSLVVDWNTHLAIRSTHPSPFSAHKGFFGSKPFSRANTFLREAGVPEVDWEKYRIE